MSARITLIRSVWPASSTSWARDSRCQRCMTPSSSPLRIRRLSKSTMPYEMAPACMSKVPMTAPVSRSHVRSRPSMAPLTPRPSSKLPLQRVILAPSWPWIARRCRSRSESQMHMMPSPVPVRIRFFSKSASMAVNAPYLPDRKELINSKVSRFQRAKVPSVAPVTPRRSDQSNTATRIGASWTWSSPGPFSVPRILFPRSSKSQSLTVWSSEVDSPSHLLFLTRFSKDGHVIHHFSSLASSSSRCSLRFFSSFLTGPLVPNSKASMSPSWFKSSASNAPTNFEPSSSAPSAPSPAGASPPSAASTLPPPSGARAAPAVSGAATQASSREAPSAAIQCQELFCAKPLSARGHQWATLGGWIWHR
mmetsp:Transcript_77584/g.251187  ORF Transcript_77584/g.251187 Transcript_77584/m.251187 type:complete len:364 (-) Transcript_77584:22-1113(-)